MTSKEVENLADQTKLAEIAKNDTDYEIRRDAVIRLTDQIVLSDIVVNDESWIVTNEAFKKISDQTALARIAKNTDCDNDFRMEAINKLVDKDTLEQIAKNDYIAEIRCQAITRLYKINKISYSDTDDLIAAFFEFMSSVELTWSPSVCNIVHALESFDYTKFGVKIEKGYADGYSWYSIHYKGKQIWRG